MEDIKNDEIISLIFKATGLIREQTAGHEKVNPLTIARVKILAIVLEKKNPTMKEIADALFITSPSATSAIDPLVCEGQLKRTSDSEDRRIVRLEITEKGKKIYKEGFKKMKEKMSEVLDKLDDKDKESFAKLLNKIILSYRR